MRVKPRVVGTIFLLATLAAFFATAAFGRPGGYSPAAAGEPTYILSSLTVVGPMKGEPNQNLVEVSYTTEWVGSTWPGYAECQIRVLDSGGRVLGSTSFQRSNFLPHPVETSMEVELGSSSRASADSAEGDCSEAQKPSETAGYRLTNLRMAGSDDDPFLTFNASWSTSEPPLYQECDLGLTFDDGSSKEITFGISLPNDASGHVLLSPATGQSVPETVQCHPYTGVAP